MYLPVKFHGDLIHLWPLVTFLADEVQNQTSQSFVIWAENPRKPVLTWPISHELARSRERNRNGPRNRGGLYGTMRLVVFLFRKPWIMGLFII